MRGKILLLSTCFRPNVGGVETHLNDLIEEGAKRGWRFVVITYQPLITKAKGKYVEKIKGALVYRIPWFRMNLFLILEKYPALEFLYLFPGLLVFSFFYLLFKSSEIKTIHAQGVSAGTVGLVLAKLFGKKIIISTHSIYHFPDRGFYFRFIKFLFDNSDHTLTLSKQSKKEVEKLGVDSKNVSVFTYWVDQNRFTPQDKARTRKELGFNTSDFICLFVGRLVEAKGVKELVEAAKIVSPEINIAIVGDGPLGGRIRNYEPRIKNLIFFGKVENDKLPLYYNASNILIIPSTHEEGFGRVILEAMSCGLPIVGSKRGAIPEAMDETVGYFINATPLSIKNTLEYIYKNKKELNEKAKKTRRYALRKYSSNNIRMIIKYYE